MDDDDVDRILKSALGRLPARLPAPGNADEHPSVGDIAELRSGSLPASRSHEVTVHLDMCPRCARTFLDFDVPPPLDAADDNFDENAGWERVSTSVRDPTTLVGAAARRASALWPARPLQVALPLAAGLFLGIGVGMGRDRTAGFTVQTQSSSVEVFKAGLLRDGSDRPRARGVLAGPGSVLFVVATVAKNTTGAPVNYEARLVRTDAPGGTALRTWPHVVVREESDLIIVDIPAGSVPAGRYELLVRPAGSPVPREPEAYSLDLSTP